MKQVCIIFIALSTIVINSCNSKINIKEQALTYEKAYASQFDSLISQFDYPIYKDTLRTELYIAVKTFKDDDSCGEIILDRVSKLLIIDSIPENQRLYLQNASIVYSARKDYDKFWETAKKEWETYPHDSFERLSSYAMYYSIIKQNTDSAKYYISSAKDAVLKLKSSDNSEDRIGYCIGIAVMFVLEGDDEAAKSSIQEYITNEHDKENIEIARELLVDFEQFKAEILRTI